MKNKIEDGNKIKDLISQYIISKGGRELGITWNDIEKYILTPEQYKRFDKWMTGQTCGCVDDTCQTWVVYLRDLNIFIGHEK